MAGQIPARHELLRSHRRNMIPRLHKEIMSSNTCLHNHLATENLLLSWSGMEQFNLKSRCVLLVIHSSGSEETHICLYSLRSQISSLDCSPNHCTAVLQLMLPHLLQCMGSPSLTVHCNSAVISGDPPDSRVSAAVLSYD